jgi:hypothetical protein
MVKLRRRTYAQVLGPNGGTLMFTYFLVASAVVLVVAGVWQQVRTWDRPGRHITQNAPMDDAMNSRARFQHDLNSSSQSYGGGAGS